MVGWVDAKRSFKEAIGYRRIRECEYQKSSAQNGNGASIAGCKSSAQKGNDAGIGGCKSSDQKRHFWLLLMNWFGQGK